MVEIDVILVCIGQTITSYHEKYINRKGDGKKSKFFQLRFSLDHQIVKLDGNFL